MTSHPNQPQAPPPNPEAPDTPQHLLQANKLFQAGVALIYGRRKLVDKAIKCVQKAITLNDNDHKYWQLLGEAYYQRGSLSSAINCFLRSQTIANSLLDASDGQPPLDEAQKRRTQSDFTYSKLRMSDIRLSVGHYEEAQFGYQDIISTEPENVAALIGLSKTRLQNARNCFNSGMVKSGHEHCMKALSLSLRAIRCSPHLCTPWKTAADCCMMQFVYGQRGHFKVPLDEPLPGQEHGECLLLDRKSCITLGHQFLTKSIEVDPFQRSGCLWHNLGICLYLKSTLITQQIEREVLLKRALKCCLMALDSDRDNSQIKNSIGVIAFNLNLINCAQKFIINSIRSNMSTSELQFSNLGYIYLQKGEFRLAKVAFGRCQAEEPLYSRSWLGNALLNEQDNIDNLSQLQHCSRLDNNYEAQLKFASKVASLPNDLCYKKDITNALDCMCRLINYNPDSFEANCILGLLFEKSNHQESAQKCFETAYRLSVKDTRAIFNRLRLHSAMSSCYTDRQPLEEEFINYAEKLTDGGNAIYVLNFIFYLLKNRDYKNVTEKMTRFIEKLATNNTRTKIGAQLILGLAAKAEAHDYKSWLYKNIIDCGNNISIEVVINLLCLMLFASCEGDDNLVRQSYKDLTNCILLYLSSQTGQFTDILNSPDGFWIRLSLLSCIFCVEDSSSLLGSLVALFPTIGELWLYMGLNYLTIQSKQESAALCITRAAIMDSNMADITMICDLMLGTFVKPNRKNIQAKEAYISRAIYKHPHYIELWDLLKNVNDFENTSVDMSACLILAIRHMVSVYAIH